LVTKIALTEWREARARKSDGQEGAGQTEHPGGSDNLRNPARFDCLWFVDTYRRSLVDLARISNRRILEIPAGCRRQWYRNYWITDTAKVVSVSIRRRLGQRRRPRRNTTILRHDIDSASSEEKALN